MDIEWYRDLSIAVMGLLVVLALITLIIVSLALYFKVRSILKKAQMIENKAELFVEQRLAGTRLGMLLGSLGTLVGAGVYSYRSRKKKKNAEKAI